jgi:hypothetical protein
VILVSKEYLTLNAPVVVDEVGIIKIHAPSFALWWETAQKQNLCILGQERDKRMILYAIHASRNILRVQIGLHIINYKFATPKVQNNKE